MNQSHVDSQGLMADFAHCTLFQNISSDLRSFGLTGVLTKAYSGPERFTMHPKYGFVYSLPTEEGLRYMPRGPIDVIKFALNQDEKQENAGTQTEVKHGSSQASDAFIYWFSQLMHYGQPATASTFQAKQILRNAIRDDTCQVPLWLTKLEQELYLHDAQEESNRPQALEADEFENDEVTVTRVLPRSGSSMQIPFPVDDQEASHPTTSASPTLPKSREHGDWTQLSTATTASDHESDHDMLDLAPIPLSFAVTRSPQQSKATDTKADVLNYPEAQEKRHVRRNSWTKALPSTDTNSHFNEQDKDAGASVDDNAEGSPMDPTEVGAMCVSIEAAMYDQRNQKPEVSAGAAVASEFSKTDRLIPRKVPRILPSRAVPSILRDVFLYQRTQQSSDNVAHFPTSISEGMETSDELSENKQAENRKENVEARAEIRPKIPASDGSKPQHLPNSRKRRHYNAFDRSNGISKMGPNQPDAKSLPGTEKDELGNEVDQEQASNDARIEAWLLDRKNSPHVQARKRRRRGRCSPKKQKLTRHDQNVDGRGIPVIRATEEKEASPRPGRKNI